MKSKNIFEKEKELVDKEKKLVESIGRKQQAVFMKYPLVFTLLATFGLVATFYGFERIIDKVDLFRDNPLILLGTGLFTLVITGSLYKKLQ